MADLVPVKKEDFLQEDPLVRGQKYVCMSFISPNDVLANKEVYFFNKFLKHITDDIELLFNNMTLKFQDDPAVVDMIKNVKDRYSYLSDVDVLQKELDIFKETHNDTLEAEFLEKNNFRTTIQGFKVRGVYETLKEAKNRAENVRKFDEKFDVYIAEVGCWCPWNPYPSVNIEEEFQETQLNTLMKKYKENQSNKDEFFRKRLADKIQETKDFDEVINKASDSKLAIEDVEDDIWLKRQGLKSE